MIFGEKIQRMWKRWRYYPIWRYGILWFFPETRNQTVKIPLASWGFEITVIKNSVLREMPKSHFHKYPNRFRCPIQWIWMWKTMALKRLENKMFGENLTFGGEIGVSMTTWPVSTLQKHNNKNLKQIFPEKKLRDLSPNFHSRVSVSVEQFIYSHDWSGKYMWTNPGNI